MATAATTGDPFAPGAGRRFPAPIHAYVDGQATAHHVESELAVATNDNLSVHEGGLAQALSVPEWPPNLAGLLVDISRAPSPTGDLAVLLSVLPRNCVVIALGEANDVGLFRDLTGIGIADYLVKPLQPGALVTAFEKAAAAKAREQALARAGIGMTGTGPQGAANAGNERARVISVIGSRGGTGATTLAICVAAMIAKRLSKEVLLLDFDLHFGSMMLALDLDASDALSEALVQPDRIDNFFIEQAVQRKGDHLRVLAAEEPPQNSVDYHPGAIDRLMEELSRRFGWVVIDVPRADTVAQRHIIQSSTDVVVVCDLSLPGVRDAMRLQQLITDVNPEAKVHVTTSGAVDPKRAPVKLADVERSLKRKVDLQIPFDSKNASAAVNSGKPLSETAPTGAVVKALTPLVVQLLGDADQKVAGKSLFGKLLGKS